MANCCLYASCTFGIYKKQQLRLTTRFYSGGDAIIKILPVSLAQHKDKSGNFYIHLINLYLKTGKSYFAICDVDIFFSGKNYLRMPCELGVTKQTVDAKIDNMEISIADVTDAFKLAMFQGLDFRGCRLEVIRVHYPECLTANDFDYVFWGNLDVPSLDDAKSVFRATVKNPFGNYETGRTAMLSCNAEFGDPNECGANKDAKASKVESGNQSIIYDTNRAESADYWKDGLFTINYEARRVISSAPGAIFLEFPFTFAINPGDSYRIERGCNKFHKTCIHTFNNGRNFSGFPAIPFENVIKT